jgi:hypothetical protein
MSGTTRGKRLMQAVAHGPVMAMLVAVVLAAGCSSTSASLTSSPSVRASEAGVPTHTLGPTVTPVASAGATAKATVLSTATPVTSRTPGNALLDTTVVTVVDGLRVRSKPRVADDSSKLEPVLPLGAQMFVLDGPISASGYTWYEVAPLGSRTLPQGWVAAGSRTGQTWLAPGTFGCPPVPTDFKSLAALRPAVGLACFPRTPITVVARLIGCNCDIDGGWFTPGWFSSGTGAPEMLVEPQMTRPPSDVGDWFWLNLDPAGQRPKALPVGEVVELTGVFDHPAAAGCTFTALEGKPVPSQHCRLAFAVERLVAKP